MGCTQSQSDGNKKTKNESKKPLPLFVQQPPSNNPLSGRHSCSGPLNGPLLNPIYPIGAGYNQCGGGGGVGLVGGTILVGGLLS
jgi:hypothetical protein